MKNIFLILSFVFVSTISVKAQDSQTAWADKLFKRFEYLDASKEYLKLVGTGIKQNYIYNQLAESYYNMFNTTEAIKWYALSLTQPQEAETYFKYAQMLKASGRYEESNAQMAIFANKNPKDREFYKIPTKSFNIEAGGQKDIEFTLNIGAVNDLDSRKKGGLFNGKSHSAEYKDGSLKVTITRSDGTAKSKEYTAGFGKYHPDSY